MDTPYYRRNELDLIRTSSDLLRARSLTIQINAIALTDYVRELIARAEGVSRACRLPSVRYAPVEAVQ